MDYEKRRHQRINKKVQELEASRKRTENEVPLEKLEDTKKVEPRISHVSLEKQKVSHFQIESNQHGLVDIKSLNLVNEPTANETRNFDENREKALEGDHSIPDVLPQEPETLPNPISSGISVTLETITQTTPSLVDRDKSNSIRYIMVLTLAVTIAFSFIQPRFFKIILSLATEDDSYVVAI